MDLQGWKYLTAIIAFFMIPIVFAVNYQVNDTEMLFPMILLNVVIIYFSLSRGIGFKGQWKDRHFEEKNYLKIVYVGMIIFLIFELFSLFSLL